MIDFEKSFGTVRIASMVLFLSAVVASVLSDTVQSKPPLPPVSSVTSCRPTKIGVFLPSVPVWYIQLSPFTIAAGTCLIDVSARDGAPLANPVATAYRASPV